MHAHYYIRMLSVLMFSGEQPAKSRQRQQTQNRRITKQQQNEWEQQKWNNNKARSWLESEKSNNDNSGDDRQPTVSVSVLPFLSHCFTCVSHSRDDGQSLNALRQNLQLSHNVRNTEQQQTSL